MKSQNSLLTGNLLGCERKEAVAARAAPAVPVSDS
jgi:hypothetical protein